MLVRTCLTVLCGALLAGTAPMSHRNELVVGTSGDYAPFSTWTTPADPDESPKGLGPDLARAYAASRALEVRFVRFAWPALLADLAADRFDAALGGITVRPERSVAGRFTVPVATSGAVVLVAGDSPVRGLADLAGLRVAVNAGGHLERVARQHLAGARIEPIPDNEAVLSALADGRADAVVTDTREAPHWMAETPGLRAIGPFTRDRKAILVRADRPALAADLDAWLAAAEADGTLARLRARHLGEAAAAETTADPLSALLAAIDERLALMPAVAEAKRASGAPIDVPEREEKVLAAAVASARRAAARAGADAGARGAARETALRALFRSQMEAAKAVQRAVLARPPAPGALRGLDLAAELRPALIRIGDRIAALAVALPSGLAPADVRTAVRRELRTPDVPAPLRDAIADAVLAVADTAATRSSGAGGGEEAVPGPASEPLPERGDASDAAPQ